jgi:hypothetical protein
MKLGTTSWLIGENFLDNARLVEGRADFLELLVYTWDDAVRAKVSRWLEGLAALNLEYTVHLPTDTAPMPWPRHDSLWRAAFPCST